MLVTTVSSKRWQKAHRLFLRAGARSPLPQPSPQPEEISRGSSPALACLPRSRTP